MAKQAGQGSDNSWHKLITNVCRHDTLWNFQENIGAFALHFFILWFLRFRKFNEIALIDETFPILKIWHFSLFSGYCKTIRSNFFRGNLRRFEICWFFSVLFCFVCFYSAGFCSICLKVVFYFAVFVFAWKHMTKNELLLFCLKAYGSAWSGSMFACCSFLCHMQPAQMVFVAFFAPRCFGCTPPWHHHCRSGWPGPERFRWALSEHQEAGAIGSHDRSKEEKPTLPTKKRRHSDKHITWKNPPSKHLPIGLRPRSAPSKSSASSGPKRCPWDPSRGSARAACWIGGGVFWRCFRHQEHVWRR